jgi:predicted nucleotidyltransferase
MVKDVEPAAAVILYGSRARGEAGRWSDWDLLVVVEGDVTFNRRAAIWDRLTDLSLELKDSPVISALVVSRRDVETKRLSVLRNALREGIEL